MGGNPMTRNAVLPDPTPRNVRPGANALMVAIYVVAIANVIFAGVYYGYFTNTVYKVGSSVMQVASTLTVIIRSIPFSINK